MGELLLLRNKHPELRVAINRLLLVLNLIDTDNANLGVIRVNSTVYLTWYYGFFNKALIFKSTQDKLTINSVEVTEVRDILNAVKWLKS